MIKGYDILCFGPGDWWHMNPSCTMHIMNRLSQENRILYINPFSADLPRRITRGFSTRVFRKIRTTVSCFHRVSDSLHTFSPIFLPRQGNPLIDKMNNGSIHLQIKLVCQFLGMTPTLLWVENPRAVDSLEWFDQLPIIYHVSDSFAECPYARDPSMLQKRESLLTQKSNLLICVSESLYQAKLAIRGDCVKYLPHGVEFEKFRDASEYNIPEELKGIKRPIAGYFGTLTAQNDIELLEWCSEKAPDISFVFAGKITGGNYQTLQNRANVHFLGYVPYDRIPYLAAGFDVCLLPWRLTEWIKKCNPLKFHEYLASGRPIVSVQIPQVMSEAKDLVNFVQNKEEFLEAIYEEIRCDNVERQQRRISLASQYSWDKHIEILSNYITDMVNIKKRR